MYKPFWVYTCLIVENRHTARTYKTYQADYHTVLKLTYANFRKTFDQVKTEFSDFEGKWMD
jgi:hypothetical protein